LLTEAIPQQIWSAGSDGKVDYCNQHLLAYVGRSTTEMNGEQFFSVFHPEDLRLLRQSWDDAFASGEKFEGECRIRQADGEYRWFLVRGTPQAPAEGSIVRWYGTHIEIEDRHRAEQALIQAQSEVAHLSRTLGMGELAASIMHEISQPITAIVTHSYACREWLHAQPPNMEKASGTAEKIVQESARASAVVARVRALFQKEPPLKQSLDMNQLIQNVTRLLRDEAIRRGMLIHTQLAANLPPISVDSVQIEQVIVNLILNGMDAMAETEVARELLITSCELGSGGVLVGIEDCGAGIDPETANKIFDPFFTTKPHGVGMGLAISRSIVEAHDGRLWAVSRPSGGARFQFMIPGNA
jgi:PAS domain S-box-containing protein